MKALSLHQPHATLCVTRQPDDPRTVDPSVYPYLPLVMPMVKRIVVMPDPPPDDLTGQRIALAATKQLPPDGTLVGDYLVRRSGQGDVDYPHSDNYARLVWRDGMTNLGEPIPLPLGVIVGSATVEAILPIKRPVASIWQQEPYIAVAEYSRTDRQGLHADYWDGEKWADISDQLAYDTFTPGHHALVLTDAAPTTERCPWCWDTTDEPDGSGRCENGSAGPLWLPNQCRVCSGWNGDPIPWTSPGGTGIGEWMP